MFLLNKSYSIFGFYFSFEIPVLVCGVIKVALA